MNMTFQEEQRWCESHLIGFVVDTETTESVLQEDGLSRDRTGVRR